MTYAVSEKIEIIGFLDIRDIGSPATVARHLILPRSSKDRAQDGMNVQYIIGQYVLDLLSVHITFIGTSKPKYVVTSLCLFPHLLFLFLRFEFVVPHISSIYILYNCMLIVIDIFSKDKENKNSKEDDEDTQEDGKTPSFTVLLHGSLKVEGMVAIARAQ